MPGCVSPDPDHPAHEGSRTTEHLARQLTNEPPEPRPRCLQARGVRYQAAGRGVDGNSTFSLRTNATKCELAGQASSTPYAAASAPLPATIERKTFADFLTCGDPAHGFVQLRCTECEHERAVAFSCKRRGVCTSCAGRRTRSRST
jgi:hypothetical protein